MQTTNARPFWGIVLVVLAIGLGGCATLFTRPSQHVPIDSIPPAAQVFVDGTFVGTTPIALELEKRAEHEVLLRLGDQEQTVTLRSGIDGAYVALDVAVDAGTGRWYRLTPGEVLVVFD